jgi:magnesium-transporting ATPase (P-type)
MMQSQDQNNIDLRVRTMRIIWFAMFLSVLVYFLISVFKTRSASAGSNNTLFLVLVAVGLSTTLVSFVVKNVLVKRATEQRQPQLLQQAYILTWALNEVPALLGLVDFYGTGDRYYYVLFIVSACGQLLHFPQREQVVNASFKNARH